VGARAPASTARRRRHRERLEHRERLAQRARQQHEQAVPRHAEAQRPPRASHQPPGGAAVSATKRVAGEHHEHEEGERQPEDHRMSSCGRREHGVEREPARHRRKMRSRFTAPPDSGRRPGRPEMEQAQAPRRPGRAARELGAWLLGRAPGPRPRSLDRGQLRTAHPRARARPGGDGRGGTPALLEGAGRMGPFGRHGRAAPQQRARASTASVVASPCSIARSTSTAFRRGRRAPNRARRGPRARVPGTRAAPGRAPPRRPRRTAPRWELRRAPARRQRRARAPPEAIVELEPPGAAGALRSRNRRLKNLLWLPAASRANNPPG